MSCHIGGGRHSHPRHRLDDDRHRAHAGDRGRRRLDVIGAVTSGRAVAEGYRRAEYSGENLPADEEAQREVHVRRGDAAQRTEDQDADGAQQRVVLPRAGLGQPRPARRGLGKRHRCGGHGPPASLSIGAYLNGLVQLTIPGATRSQHCDRPELHSSGLSPISLSLREAADGGGERWLSCDCKGLPHARRLCCCWVAATSRERAAARRRRTPARTRPSRRNPRRIPIRRRSKGHIKELNIGEFDLVDGIAYPSMSRRRHRRLRCQQADRLADARRLGVPADAGARAVEVAQRELRRNNARRGRAIEILQRRHAVRRQPHRSDASRLVEHFEDRRGSRRWQCHAPAVRQIRIRPAVVECPSSTR